MAESLQHLYETHHVTGARLRQTVLENRRGEILRNWIGTGKKVVDLGCRDATLTRHFVEGNEVTGCDIDRSALEYAAETYGISTQQVDLNSPLPFGDAEFDVVVMGEVLEHLPYWGITLPQVQRILRSGGEFVGSIPLAYHLNDRWRVLRGKKLLAASDPTHLQLLSFDEFVERMRDYFEVIEIVAIKGGEGWRARYPRLFARNVAFRCRKR
jgi:SAM-dependent methyltransferase